MSPFTGKQLNQEAPKEKPVQDAVALAPTTVRATIERETLEAEQVYRKGVVSIRDVIAPASLKVEATHVRLGQKFLRTTFVTTYPRYISVGWFAPIINFSAMLDIAMYFYPVKTAIVMKQLKNQVGVLEAQLSADAEKGAPRDPIRETALKDIEQLRDSLSQGTEKFFQFALYITLYGDTLEELEELTDDVELVFGSRLVMSRRVFFQTEQGFNSTMPLGNDEIMVTANMNTSPCASSFPFISSDLTSDEGVMYGINRHNNSLVIFDRFSMQNANFTVFATSGAGKSVDRETEVLIKENECVRKVQIGELVDSLGRERGFESIDEELEGVVDPGIAVYTFDRELKGAWSPVRVAARKEAPQSRYRFTTQSGREITATGDHNMLVLRDGKTVAAKSSDVRIGERVPLPRAIPEPEAPTDSINVLQLHSSSVSVTPALARLLGYIVSEGTIGDDFILISNEDQEVIDDITRCLSDLGWTYFRRASDGSFVISSRVHVAFLQALGVGGKAGEKRVPPFLFNCTNAIIAAFLRAYFEGDGGVEQHSVTACSKSKGLVSDLAYLLTRFGIITRLASRWKRATNARAARARYWICTISGQSHCTLFSKEINFISARKQQRLASIIGFSANTNVDTIPVQAVIQELTTLFRPQLAGLQDVIELKNGSYTPSPEKLKDVIVQIEERVHRFIALKPVFARIAGLPSVAAVLQYAGASVEYDAALSQTLGDRWRLMRAGEVAPRSHTVLTAAKIVFGVSCSLDELKSGIREGFKTLGLSMKELGRGFTSALSEKNFSQDTRYAMLHSAAEKVWNAYTHFEYNLPRVQACIETLRHLADADLFWDPIVRIKKERETNAHVYDLTVDNEVFLAGHGGLFVHNSYAIKLEVLRSLMQRIEVIIIDPEMEYRALSDAVGGTYVNVSLASEAKINPFDLPRPVGQEVETGDIIRSAVITMKGLLRLMLGNFTTQEDSLIDRALLETYAKKDITPESDLTTIEPPLMQDLYDILQGMEGAEDISLRLKKYVDGTFSGLFNSPTNVDMRNQLVIFSVRDLEDELRPIAIYSIVNYIWNVVRSEVRKRILVIDEAWWLMQNPDSAKFIFALVKRCRKYYLGVTTITQDVNDFLTSPYGQAILNNSALQLLLKQAPAAVAIVQKTFMLTEGEKYLLLESGVGEGIFFAGQKHAAIAIKASYAEDQLITSDPRQLLEIEDAKRAFAEEHAKQSTTDNV